MTGWEPRSAYVGIDVGGTSIKVLVADERARPIATLSRPTFDVGSTALDTLDTLIADSAASARAAGLQLGAIGICSPGTVDAAAGVVRFAANLGWTELPLASELERRHGLPVSLDHDARAAAAAEAAARGSASAPNMLFIPIGTGVSASVVHDGAVVQGGSGAVGELGHMIVFPDGEACGCGQRGCVEAYAGGAGLLRRYRRAGGRAETVEDLVASVGTDRIARQVWAEAVDALARGIHGAIALLDPTEVVIGGGLSRAGARLLQPLRVRLEHLLAWRSTPRLSVSILGPAAGLIGATALALPSRPDTGALIRLAKDLRGGPKTPTSTDSLEATAG